MIIYKKKDCRIVIQDDETICNVTVSNEPDLDKTGEFIHPDGTKHYVCNDLAIDKGHGTNIEVLAGGHLGIYDGSADDIKIHAGGVCHASKFKIKNIQELGGFFHAMDNDAIFCDTLTEEIESGDKSYAQFLKSVIELRTIEGDISAHIGTSIIASSLPRYAHVFIYDGGSFHGCTVEDGTIEIHKGGRLDSIVFRSGGLEIIGGATLQNVRMIGTPSSKPYTVVDCDHAMVNLDQLTIGRGTIVYFREETDVDCANACQLENGALVGVVRKDNPAKGIIYRYNSGKFELTDDTFTTIY